MLNLMTITFFEPFYFTLLLSLLGLLAIYYLFRHSKIKVVSSLFLWEQQIKTNKSGRILKRLPLPLTFFIECLIILLLTLAAVDVMIPRKGVQETATIVLDNSFSMQAKLPTSQREIRLLVLDKLEKILKERHKGQKIRIFLAGRTTKNLGVFSNINKILLALEKSFSCNENKSNLVESMAIAKKMNLPNSPIYIFTDNVPIQNLSSEIKWHAVGINMANTAIVNCSRTKIDNLDKCMFVIANLSSKKAYTLLRISPYKNKKNKQNLKEIKKNILLKPNSFKKITVTLPAKTGAVVAEISDDNLNFDNKVVLLPENLEKLKIKLNISNKNILNLVKKALEASGKVILNSSKPDLVISDDYKNFKKNKHNMLIIDSKTFANVGLLGNDGKKQNILSKQSFSFTAPFTVDRSQKIMQGVNLKNVIWGSFLLNNTVFSKTGQLKEKQSLLKSVLDKLFEAEPIIMVKQNLLLASKFDKITDKENIFMFFEPAKSTVQSTPAFPVLFWNIVDWLINKKSGLLRHNFRSGDQIYFKCKNLSENAKLKVFKNDEEFTTLHKNYSQKYFINTNEPGIYTIKSKLKDYRFSVNPLSFAESDLKSGKITKVCEKKRDKLQAVRYFYSLGWVFLVLVLVLMVYHYYLISEKKEVR